MYNIDTNYSYTASVDIYSEVRGIVYFIARLNNENIIIKNISFPSSPLKQTVTITINNTEFNEELDLHFRVINLEQGKIYTDNWRLIYS
ncbi:MAG: hypothetical protein IJF83_06045 [Methanobrevibacter sp.]|nr:hypothetical protein [Methanobrevibacter sp.]